MLPEMVRSEELFCLVAFTEFVGMTDVISSMFPIRWIRKLFTAEAADICGTPVGLIRMERRLCEL